MFYSIFRSNLFGFYFCYYLASAASAAYCFFRYSACFYLSDYCCLSSFCRYSSFSFSFNLYISLSFSNFFFSSSSTILFIRSLTSPVVLSSSLLFYSDKYPFLSSS